MEKEFYTVEELSEIWGLKIETIRTYIRTNQLEAIKFGNTYRVRTEEKKRFEDARRTKKDKPMT